MTTLEFNYTEVVESAMELFWKNGYTKSSTQDIYDVTNLPLNHFQETFHGKPGIFQVALDHYSETIFEQLNVDLMHNNSVEIGICNFLLRYIRSTQQPEFCGCFLIKSQLELQFCDDQHLKAVATKNLKQLENTFFQALTTCCLYEFEARKKGSEIMLAWYGIHTYIYLNANYDNLINCMMDFLPWLPWGFALSLDVNDYQPFYV